MIGLSSDDPEVLQSAAVYLELADAKREIKELHTQLTSVVQAMQQVDIDCAFLPDRVSIYIHAHARLIEQVCRITGTDPKTTTVEQAFAALAKLPSAETETA
jgi:hypothetical protein